MTTLIDCSSIELDNIANNLYRYGRIHSDIRSSVNNTRYTTFEIEPNVSYTMVCMRNGKVYRINSAQNTIVLMLTVNTNI